METTALKVSVFEEVKLKDNIAPRQPKKKPRVVMKFPIAMDLSYPFKAEIAYQILSRPPTSLSLDFLLVKTAS